MTSMAPGTVIVISTMGMPPSQTASAAMRASRGDDARTTGTIPISVIRSRTSCLSILRITLLPANSSSPCDACSNAFHHLHHFLEGHHGRVSRRGHGERSVRGPAFHGPLRILTSQESVDQAGSKRIAPSHAIKNFQILAVFRLIELAIAITDGAPIIQCGGFCLSQRGGNNFERIILHRLRDHLLEAVDLKPRVMLIHARHLVTERRREVFLVAKHDINLRCDSPVDFLGLSLAAKGLPQRGAVIQVIGNDGAVPPGSLHSFQSDFRGRRRQSAENAPRMEPARAMLSKNLIPINVTRLKLRNRSIPAIVTPQCRTHAETALRKIQTVARHPAHSIMFDPAHQRLVHAALVYEVLQKTPNGIIGECRSDRRVQAETALQSARDVVFPAPLAHVEGSRRGDAPLAGVEPHHDLAQTDHVPAALFLWPDRQRHAFTSTAPSKSKNCYWCILTDYAECFQNHVCASIPILAGSSLGARTWIRAIATK